MYTMTRTESLGLRLRFAPDNVAHAALPWELFWPPESAPLLLSRGQLATCTRYLDLPQALPAITPVHRPLRVLAIAPTADIPPNVGQDERAVRERELEPLVKAHQLEMREVNPARREDVIAAMQAFRPDVVHFYGHGRYKDGQGALLLDRDEGDKRDWTPVTNPEVMLGGVRLVLLFACQGTMATEGGILAGVAPPLCAANVPLVVAMQLTAHISAATQASETIYRALMAGRNLQDTVGEARQALYVDEADKALWYVPKLYIRAREAGPVRLVSRAQQ